MNNPSLEEMLSRARHHRMTPQEQREQGISYILGNASVEVPNIYRGTVTLAVPREALGPGTMVGSIATDESEPRIPFDVNGAVRQFRLVQTLVEKHASTSEPFAIDAALICQLHAAAGDPANKAFGNFREKEVQVGSHRAPPPSQVAALVDEFCAELRTRWETEEPLRLSAFALWRLNWIHPFIDANGRTARALSYLILNLKFGINLPGAPTLLEQLSDRRIQYFDALSTADATFSSTGVADLLPLSNLLEELLIRQLRNLPAQSDNDDLALADVFKRRVMSADPDSLIRLFGEAAVCYRAWASGDTLIVHIGSSRAVEHAEQLFEQYGRPFPGLVSGAGEVANMTLGPAQRGAIIRLREFETENAALSLEPNTAVVIEAPQIVLKSAGKLYRWEVDGALYVLRAGERISGLWRIDVLDWLISRHLSEG